MKLTKTHLMVGGGLVAAGAVALVVATRSGEKLEKVEAPASEQSPHSARAREKIASLKNQKRDAPKNENLNMTAKLRSFDKEIIDYLLGPAPDKDAKNVLPRLLPQVNAYVSAVEGAAPRFHKLEIDLDRDGQADERWLLLEDQTIQRRAMLPNAELRIYRDIYKLTGEEWTLIQGRGETLTAPEPDPAVVAANTEARELRPLDQKVLDVARHKGPGTYSFAQPDGTTAKIIVKKGRRDFLLTVQIDLQNDGSIDENWSVGPHRVRRSVELGPEQPTQRFSLTQDNTWNKLR